MNQDKSLKTKKISLENTKGITQKKEVKFDIFGNIIPSQSVQSVQSVKDTKVSS